METQKTQNCQSHPEGKEQSWRYNTYKLQTKLKSYNNQNSTVLAKKQTYRSMEQNRELRNKPMHLWSIDLQTRKARIHNGKKTVFSGGANGRLQEG